VARHETFNAFMTSLLAYAPLVGVIAYFTGEKFGILFSGLFTIGFWLLVVGYFVLDYRKRTKKVKPKPLFTPLASDTSAKDTITELTQFRKIQNWGFFILEIIEAVLFLSLTPLFWQFYEINGVGIITYSNLLLLGFFALGLFLTVDIVRRIRNPKKIMEFT
jgi:hypothetical protein